MAEVKQFERKELCLNCVCKGEQNLENDLSTKIRHPKNDLYTKVRQFPIENLCVD